VALAAKALELLLVNGTTYYVALGTDADLLTGTFVELTDSGYARKGHSAWITAIASSRITRKNNGAIVFDALVEGESSVVWWAIFDAATDGNMLACDLVLNIAGEPEPFEVPAGDQARFNNGELLLFSIPPEA
jgi:hypothetical protein